jgi:RNA polymerase sigma-70 factor (ECF subfamily)
MGDGGWPARDEDELVELARSGSHEAMVELYTRHRGLVTGYVVRMTGDRELADEVFAATFATFFDHLRGYRSGGQLAAYLLRVARSRLADEVRARGRLGRLLPRAGWDGSPGAEPIDPGPDPGDAAARWELAHRAEQALRRLSGPLREVVVLRLYEALDYATIAEIIGVGEATARSRMRYALRALRHALDASPEPYSHAGRGNRGDSSASHFF